MNTKGKHSTQNNVSAATFPLVRCSCRNVVHAPFIRVFWVSKPVKRGEELFTAYASAKAMTSAYQYPLFVSSFVSNTDPPQRQLTRPDLGQEDQEDAKDASCLSDEEPQDQDAASTPHISDEDEGGASSSAIFDDL